jgi:hypothetical protein
MTGCYKQLFASTNEARSALKNQRDKGNVRNRDGKAELVVYKCGECAGWHLGSRIKPVQRKAMVSERRIVRTEEVWD